MTIKTRYRDVPFAVVLSCLTECGIAERRKKYDDPEAAWKRVIGRVVEIYVPAISTPQYKFVKCGGPFFQIRNSDGIVCPHIAEIGD